jgi:hypothetical protein
VLAADLYKNTGVPIFSYLRLGTRLVQSTVQFFISVCSNYLGIHSKKIIKDKQMSATSTLDVRDLMKLINSTLEALGRDSNETSTSVKSNFTITGNMTAAHDGRLGNTKGSWCASENPLVGDHHLIVDLGMPKVILSNSGCTPTPPKITGVRN